VLRWPSYKNRLYRSWHFQVGTVLFLAVELWRDFIPRTSRPMILVRLGVFVTALGRELLGFLWAIAVNTEKQKAA